MAGNQKYADRMGKHLAEQIEAACPITRPGGTKAQIGGAVGGLAGAAIASGGTSTASDVAVGQYGWLGLGATHFALTNASMTGKPKGEPLARIAYTDVSGIDVAEGKLTLRVDLDLQDGRHVAFEVKRQGQGRSSAEVVEMLRHRCTPTG